MGIFDRAESKGISREHAADTCEIRQRPKFKLTHCRKFLHIDTPRAMKQNL
jgi:hypothetical protein